MCLHRTNPSFGFSPPFLKYGDRRKSHHRDLSRTILPHSFLFSLSNLLHCHSHSLESIPPSSYSVLFLNRQVQPGSQRAAKTNQSKNQNNSFLNDDLCNKLDTTSILLEDHSMDCNDMRCTVKDHGFFCIWNGNSCTTVSSIFFDVGPSRDFSLFDSGKEEKQALRSEMGQKGNPR